jgi:hypothetical protein
MKKLKRTKPEEIRHPVLARAFTGKKHLIVD